MKTMRAVAPILLAMVVVAGFGYPDKRTEYRFTIHELEDQRADWSPAEISVRQELLPKADFVLENPSHRTHIFEAPGLLGMVIDEQNNTTAKPVRVTVAPEETVRVQITGRQLADNDCPDGTTCHRFFCPLHRPDTDPGGIIFIQRGS